MLSTTETLAAIAVMAVVTFLTRALPFLLFDRKGNPPRLVLYLGRVLPPAIIAMLIVYCLKDSLLALELHPLQGYETWLPALISITVAIILHLWKRNTLLSIFGSTILHMFLVQAVFVV